MASAHRGIQAAEERVAALRSGYRVEPRIVLWEADDVLEIPLPALFRDGEGWALFAEQRGHAVLRHVECTTRSRTS